MIDLGILIGSCSLFILSLMAALNFYFQKRWRLFALMVAFVLLSASSTAAELYNLLALPPGSPSTLLLPARPL